MPNDTAEINGGNLAGIIEKERHTVEMTGNFAVEAALTAPSEAHEDNETIGQGTPVAETQQLTGRKMIYAPAIGRTGIRRGRYSPSFMPGGIESRYAVPPIDTVRPTPGSVHLTPEERVSPPTVQKADGKSEENGK